MRPECQLGPVWCFRPAIGHPLMIFPAGEASRGMTAFPVKIELPSNVAEPCRGCTSLSAIHQRRNQLPNEENCGSKNDSANYACPKCSGLKDNDDRRPDHTGHQHQRRCRGEEKSKSQENRRHQHHAAGRWGRYSCDDPPRRKKHNHDREIPGEQVKRLGRDRECVEERGLLVASGKKKGPDNCGAPDWFDWRDQCACP